MNELKKSHINNLVAQYHKEKAEAQLAKVYRSLQKEYRSKLEYWSSTTFMSGSHEMQELFDDVFMKSLEVIGNNGGDFVKLFHLSLGNRYKDLLRKLKTVRKFGRCEIDNDDPDAATFDVVSDFNLAEEVTERLSRKEKNDQRMLIEFLVSGENERTTAIVQAYLTTDLKTPTAIGKHLGIDHKQVSRALSRLQAKYSTKKFGSHLDYLIAL